MPSSFISPAENIQAFTRTGRSTPERLKVSSFHATSDSNDLLRACQSRKSGYETERRIPLALVSSRSARRSGSRYGSGRRRTPFTTLKRAVAAPIETARMPTTVAAWPRDRQRDRSASRTSRKKVFKGHLAGGEVYFFSGAA